MRRPPEFVRTLLPRELAPGIFWLGECLALPYKDTVLHSCSSVYLIRGEEGAVLVDCGYPSDRAGLYDQLDRVLADGPPLRHLFLTHQEVPHAGAIGHLLKRYPEAVAIGDVRDYHLVFPDLAHRFVDVPVGHSIDLGGTSFEIVEAIVKDLTTTRWGFATEQRTLFSADGFAFAHYHEAAQCGMTAEEVPQLDIGEMGSVINFYALPWMQVLDTEPYVQAIAEMLDERQVEIVASTHGLPITELDRVMPQIYEGMRAATSVN
jgi:flavorubredoxin